MFIWDLITMYGNSKKIILKINYLEICNFCIFKLGTQRITSTIHQNINIFFLFFDNLVEKKNSIQENPSFKMNC